MAMPAASFIARALVSLDRGAAVRTPDSYRRLVEAHFENIETWLWTDMLPVPYSHFVIRATVLSSSEPSPHGPDNWVDP